MIATFVEVLQEVIVRCKVDAFQLVISHYLRNALHAEFIERVKGQLLDSTRSEMFIVVFGDDILNKMVFCLGNLSVRPFPYEHNKILQESDLLNVEFFPFDGKRIH